MRSTQLVTHKLMIRRLCCLKYTFDIGIFYTLVAGHWQYKPVAQSHLNVIISRTIVQGIAYSENTQISHTPLQFAIHVPQYTLYAEMCCITH